MSPMSKTPPIRTREALIEHLHAAVQLELAVIPPYLCALYTLRPGANEEASLIIRSVVVEEMLHMVLAANVLNAVGGTPRVANPADAPRYPAYLPDGERRFEVHLERFSRDALDTFLKIEEPSLPHTPEPELQMLKAVAARREPTPLKLMQWHYATVGEFYAAIVHGLEWLTKELGEQALFCGDRARQVTSAFYYAGGGAPVEVHDLATARAALDEIVEQGEGEIHSIYDGDGDLGHFFRFMEIRHDRRYQPEALRALNEAIKAAPDRHPAWPLPTGAPLGVDWNAVYPMLRNPRTEDYPEGSAVRAASDAFNALWSRLLRQVERALTGEPALLLDAVGTMYDLKYAALELMRNPLPGHDALHAGPTFDYVPEAASTAGEPAIAAHAARA